MIDWGEALSRLLNASTLKQMSSSIGHGLSSGVLQDRGHHVEILIVESSWQTNIDGPKEMSDGMRCGGASCDRDKR